MDLNDRELGAASSPLRARLVLASITVMNPTVYIETTVISYLAARPSRDLIRAAQQQITHDWWARRGEFDVWISELVLAEISEGDPTAAAERLAVAQSLRSLSATREAHVLAATLVQRLAIPPNAARDAIHVAIAAVNGIEFLLTWNCRHLANLHQRGRIEQVCRDHGYQPPAIGTPNELFEPEP